MDVVNSEPMNGAGNGHPSDSHRRSRSRSPRRDDRSPPPKRSSHAQQGKAPEPSNVLGVFGLSIRTQERDLDEEFSRHGSVEKVTIVYDQRSDRSRGFGFIRMATVEDATKCIEELNGVELHGRRLRVDYSMTNKPHNPTPGEYMGRKSRDYDRRDRRDYRDDYRDRGGYRGSSSGYGRDRDRDGYGRDRDWKDRRSPPPRDRDYRRRRSYSRSPPRGSSPRRDDDRRW
ncbi:RNA-binding domain-containing protein [Flagelloscypha sp. PMI_526]|nr:RNA-binding domain-containing protein [Flagelloscypha sp. PMI_526]